MKEYFTGVENDRYLETVIEILLLNWNITWKFIFIWMYIYASVSKLFISNKGVGIIAWNSNCLYYKLLLETWIDYFQYHPNIISEGN